MGSCLTKEEQTSQMSRLSICGGNPLKGKISISGAKNASLPIMAAALLTEEAVKLSNVPNLTDVLTMINLLESHGVEIDKSRLATRSILEMRTTEITSTESPREITRQMRASVLVLGPLLARMGRAKVYLPGGCKIGSRPIDIHLSALEELGAQVIFDEASGTIEATISSGNRLRGAEIHFLRPSVGATENILMAACLADGVTTIHNAAREPEIADLAKLLNNMGARISGVGSSTLTIQGVHRLGAVEHEVLPDRIEAGTYAVAACATGGRLELENVVPSILEPILELLQTAGACVEKDERRKRVIVSAGESMKPVDVTTAPHPGFPTDMQSQWMALMCLAVGKDYALIDLSLKVNSSDPGQSVIFIH